MAAAFAGFRLAARLRRGGAPRLVWLFYGTFALGMFVVGMEECAWGQWFFHYPTPEFWDRVNIQHEMTLHNYKWMQGRTEVFRMIFCVGALVGLIARRRGGTWELVAPPAVLWPWVLTMLGVTCIDALDDFVNTGEVAERFVNKLSEVIEMMIAMTGFLYVHLNSKRLARTNLL
jgi:hypothetical protein